MAWEVIFSTRSRNDLEQIVKYIARDDPVAAERFGSKLIDQAESLADAPEMGPRLPQKPGTRFFPVGSYLIVYRVDGDPARCPNSPVLAFSASRPSDALNAAASLLLN